MKRKSKNIVSLYFVLLSFVIQNVFAQGIKVNLFEDSISKSKLVKDQMTLLDQIKSRATTKNIKIVKLSNENLIKYESIGIPLFDEEMEITREKIEVRNSDDITWYGKDSKNNNAILVKQKDNITGTIFYNNKKYKIEPLGVGFHIIIEFDESKLPPEDCEFNNNQINKEDSHLNKTFNLLSKTTTETIEDIDILVAYTQSAANASGNIIGLIQTAISEANTSYEDSNIDIRLNLAYSYQVSYSESGKTYLQIVNAFQSTSDGNMDEVHSYRNTYSADVCVLIVNNNDYCGRAFDIQVTDDGAFCAVHHDCATSYYSFAHEIGHLQGARHNRENDPSGTYEHGYRYHPSAWRTVMAYDSANYYTRLNFWSNPDQEYPAESGILRGNSEYANNTRKLNETRTSVSIFRAFTLSGTLATNESWRRELTLAGNVTVPTGITLRIESSTQCNLNGYSIISTGGIITVEGGATINGYTARITQSDQVKGYYSTFAQALSNATSGQTIELYNTVNLSSVASIGSGITLLVKSGTTINFGSYYIMSTGGTITVEGGFTNYVCLKNGGTTRGLFPTVNSALSVAQSGETIEVVGTTSLASSFELPSSYTILLKQNATLNMNGYNIVLTGGTVNFESGSSLGGLKAYLKYYSTLKGYYGTIQSAINSAGTNWTVELLASSYSTLQAMS